MRWCVLIALSITLVVPAVPVSGQDAGDTMFRAAYCVGVLKQNIKVLRQRSVEVEGKGCARYSIESPLSEFKPFGVEDCSEDLRMMSELIAELVKDQEARHKRYAQYLLLRMATASGGQQDAVVVLVKKGERDTADKVGALDHPGVSKCLKSNQSPVGALVDCVAQHDQVYANILRRQQAPDQLPF